MALLGYLLQRCNPVHLNAALLHALETLLKAVTPSEALTKQLLQQLLLNLRLWSAAPPAGQRSLQHLILKLAKAIFLRFCRCCWPCPCIFPQATKLHCTSLMLLSALVSVVCTKPSVALLCGMLPACLCVLAQIAFYFTCRRHSFALWEGQHAVWHRESLRRRIFTCSSRQHAVLHSP